MVERTAEEIDELVDECHQFLKEVARRKGLTSYTELNAVLARRTGQPMFDFQQAEERNRIARVLETANAREMEGGAYYMLTALVKYLNDNNAGPGFFALAQRLGDKLDHKLHEHASSEAKLVFWATQCEAAHAAYARRRTTA